MTTGTPGFTAALIQELLGSTPNWYGADNWDAERFGPHKASLKSLLLTGVNKLISPKLALMLRDTCDHPLGLSKIEGSLQRLSSLYDRLDDESSRKTLVKVVAYRILGYRKVKLPLNTVEYWSARRSAFSLIRGEDTIDPEFNGWVLRRLNLADIGYPIEIFFLPGGAFVTFVLKQYEYGKTQPSIKARDGDYVIDAGGCWGDTALYFAHNVGARGRVFSFEFAPVNLRVFKRNMLLNPALSERIEVIPRALWDKSGEEISYSAQGPGTSLANRVGSALRASTVSIDDFVKEKQLAQVDFIKMDIEGAEPRALRGAEATIRSSRPRLAISVYHNEEDLVEIPDYLDKIDVAYELFLDHFTIHREETVLFAVPRRG